MNHMTTHFPGYGDMGGGGGGGGGGQHHTTGPGPGSPGPQGGIPPDGMNGGFRMQQQPQQQQQTGGPGSVPGNMFQGQMEPQQQQRSMMGSSAHMAGGQVVTNNLMNGNHSIALSKIYNLRPVSIVSELGKAFIITKKKIL